MMKQISLRIPAALLAAGLTLTLLTGCGAAGRNTFFSEDASMKSAAVSAGGTVMETTAAAAPAYPGLNSSYGEMTADTADAIQPETLSGSSGGDASASVPVQAETRKLIRNMDLSVETLEFDSFLQSVEQQVTKLGGYVEQSSVNNGSMNDFYDTGRASMRYASMMLRIPADKLDAFASTVSESSNVIRKTESVSDVTLQYADVTSRLKTLRTEQDRLWALLEKAESTDAIIAIEQRLTEVSSEIESYESQVRAMDNQVSYSTVSLDISEVKKETPTAPEGITTRIQKGFSENLEGLGIFLTEAGIWLASSLPTLLFLAILILLIVFLVRKAAKRRRARGNANGTESGKKDQKQNPFTRKTSLPEPPADHTPEPSEPKENGHR